MDKKQTLLVARVFFVVALLVCLNFLFNGIRIVSAQELVSLNPTRAIELALQNNEAIKKTEKGVERAKANLRVSKAVYLPQVGALVNISGIKKVRLTRRITFLAHR